MGLEYLNLEELKCNDVDIYDREVVAFGAKWHGLENIVPNGPFIG